MAVQSRSNRVSYGWQIYRVHNRTSAPFDPPTVAVVKKKTVLWYRYTCTFPEAPDLSTSIPYPIP